MGRRQDGQETLCRYVEAQRGSKGRLGARGEGGRQRKRTKQTHFIDMSTGEGD